MKKQLNKIYYYILYLYTAFTCLIPVFSLLDRLIKTDNNWITTLRYFGNSIGNSYFALPFFVISEGLDEKNTIIDLIYNIISIVILYVVLILATIKIRNNNNYFFPLLALLIADLLFSGYFITVYQQNVVYVIFSSSFLVFKFILLVFLILIRVNGKSTIQ